RSYPLFLARLFDVSNPRPKARYRVSLPEYVLRWQWQAELLSNRQRMNALPKPCAYGFPMPEVPAVSKYRFQLETAGLRRRYAGPQRPVAAGPEVRARPILRRDEKLQAGIWLLRCHGQRSGPLHCKLLAAFVFALRAMSVGHHSDLVI